LITVKNFADISGFKTILLSTLSTESIEINIDNVIDKLFFSRSAINVVAIINHINCESGTILKIQDDIEVKWEHVDGTSPI
jgi:hypothetical protein